MAKNLRRPFSFTKVKKDYNDNIVGRVKPNGRCKKHPKHQQSPGVCSLCLKEKLTKLSSSISPRKTTNFVDSSGSSSSVSSLSSYDSSYSASSCASPMHCFDLSGSNRVWFFMMSGKQNGIMGSKSMAVFSSRRDREVGVHDHNNKSASKSSGFWSKLLHPRRKITKKDERDTKMLRSMSIRETVIVTN